MLHVIMVMLIRLLRRIDRWLPDGQPVHWQTRDGKPPQHDQRPPASRIRPDHPANMLEASPGPGRCLRNLIHAGAPAPAPHPGRAHANPYSPIPLTVPWNPERASAPNPLARNRQ